MTIGGHDVAESPLEAKRLIGYLPENAASYPDMTVRGFLEFAAELRGFRGSQKKQAVGRVVERCFLKGVLRQSIDTLSKGYKHRTCLAQALIHDPDVLIMDEPTDGLDPNQKHEVRNLIRELGRNKAIVFSTHILEEVDAACTRAIIIDRGRIVANGTPEELRAHVRPRGRGDAVRARRRARRNSPRWDGSKISTARSASIRATSRAPAELAQDGGRAGEPRRLEGGRHVQRARRARRGVPPHHAARHGKRR